MKDISKELGLPDFLDMALPPVEANYYGAAKLVAHHVGMQTPPNSLVYWKHGWDMADIVDITQVADPELKDRCHLVATQEIEAFLHQNGFSNVKAVGMPFAYTEPDPTTKRIPGSLLVMPAHTLSDLKFETQESEYLDYIRSIAKHFSRVLFCLNLSCLYNDLWVGNLEKYGFDFVPGAGIMDQNALLRMRKLFDSFECMTSNTMGSHILYAAFCGVKVSLAGPYASPSLDMYKKHPDHWGDPVSRRKNTLYVEANQYDVVKKKFPWFFRAPQNAEKHVEWARKEIGFYNKVSFSELARHLFDPDPEETKHYLETVFHLDATDDFSGFCAFIQDKRYDDPIMMVVATSQLLTKVRLRSAYTLALLSHNRGYQNAVVVFALHVGGVVGLGEPPEEDAQKSLKTLVDTLSEAQQVMLYDTIVAPVISSCLTSFVHNSEFHRIRQILDILEAMAPRFRAMVE